MFSISVSPTFFTFLLEDFLPSQLFDVVRLGKLRVNRSFRNIEDGNNNPLLPIAQDDRKIWQQLLQPGDRLKYSQLSRLLFLPLLLA